MPRRLAPPVAHGPCCDFQALRTHEACWSSVDEKNRIDEPVVKTSVPTTMRQLREATRVVHKRVESALPLLDPNLTRERYTRVVEALHGFYAEIEPVIAHALAGDCDPNRSQSRAKLPLLETDLRALGRTPTHIARLPRCATLPYAGTASHALGVLYVLEGATLGGQIIAKHLSQRLAIEAGTGGAFFHGYGDATRAMWTVFCERVDRVDSIDTRNAIDRKSVV